jgi:hypothetical protein
MTTLDEVICFAVIASIVEKKKLKLKKIIVSGLNSGYSKYPVLLTLIC